MKMNKETLIKILKGYKCSKKLIEAASRLPDRGVFGIQDVLRQLIEV